MDHTENTIYIFDTYAGVYQDKYSNQDLYLDTFKLFCNNLETSNPKVLEIACGPGNITKYLLNLRPDLQITGTDIAMNMLKLAAQNNPKATFQYLDGRKIDQLATKYEGILCGFGLPYFSKREAIQFITDAANRLQVNGVLYLSLMEDSYTKSGYQSSSSIDSDALYIYYHQADYLLTALRKNGFVVQHIIRKNSSVKNGQFSGDLILIAKRSIM